MADDETPPTNLLALRDAGRRAEDLITTRYAEGLLDDDELERRLDRLYAAGDLPTVEALVVDLVDPGQTAGTALVPTASPSPASPVALARVDEIPAVREISALFSSLEQRGNWVPGRRTQVVDIFASAILDLREAVFGPGTSLIELNCVCASLVIIVPPELAVRVEARLLFSGFERDQGIREQPRTPEEPLVIVTGRVLFASLELCERMVGESSKQAKRRHKALRKAAAQRAALPPGYT